MILWISAGLILYIGCHICLNTTVRPAHALPPGKQSGYAGSDADNKAYDMRRVLRVTCNMQHNKSRLLPAADNTASKINKEDAMSVQFWCYDMGRS